MVQHIFLKNKVQRRVDGNIHCTTTFVTTQSGQLMTVGGNEEIHIR